MLDDVSAEALIVWASVNGVGIAENRAPLLRKHRITYLSRSSTFITDYRRWLSVIWIVL